MKLGIDTSKYQMGRVDYAAAKKAGVDFVFLRIGAGKTKDPYFERDYRAAAAAGLAVGCYYYTYSMTSQQAAEDADRVLLWLEGRRLDLPVVYDLESSKQKKASRKTVNTAMYRTFAEKIQAAGAYKVMLYTGEYFFNHYLDPAGIEGDLWIAKYAEDPPRVGRPVTVWQFASGEIDTAYYKGKLDRNYLLTKGFHEAASKEEQNPYPIPVRSLKRRTPVMTGDDVKWLQWELNRAGFALAVDGKFGPETAQAVKSYQKQHGLAADGSVGPATRRMLLQESPFDGT